MGDEIIFPVLQDRWVDRREYPYDFGLRAELAWRLLSGTVNLFATATPDGEDSAGRQKIRAANAEELVEKAFALSDAFVRKAMERHEFRLRSSEAPSSAPPA